MVASLLLLPLLAACGCGGGGPTINTVSGKVTVNGKPAVDGATVTFVGSDNKPVFALVGAGGNYTITGVADGPVKISVTGVAAPTVKVDMPGMSPTGGGEPIPAKYADPNNGLSYTVKSGKQTYDIDLK